MEQQSKEWFAFRLGNCSASRVADVMASGKGGAPSASRKNYQMELLCQRLTGQREESWTSPAMQRGTDLEPIARSAYEVITGRMVIETGAHAHQGIFGFVASPDGLIDSDGLLEIKCPNTAQHVDFIQRKIPDSRYQWQMLAQMACTGRKWCDFVSFDDRMPEPLQFRHIRFMRDEKRIEEMETEVRKFLKELEQLTEEMMAEADSYE